MITWQLWNAFANIGNIFGKSQGIFENDQVSKKKIQALSRLKKGGGYSSSSWFLIMMIIKSSTVLIPKIRTIIYCSAKVNLDDKKTLNNELNICNKQPLYKESTVDWQNEIKSVKDKNCLDPMLLKFI